MSARRGETLVPLEQGLLLAALYADLFDYALTPAELHEQLVGRCAARAQADEALAGLLADGRLEARDGFVTLPGRGGLVALREERRRRASALWPQAERFARAMRRVPFVRLVAVCGSLARENAADGADVDLFVVTAPGRLWLVHLAAMALRRLLPGGAELCPNHFLTTARLAADLRTLYTAHEVVQVVPLWGGDVHASFLKANEWTRAFLPQADGAGARQRLWERRPPRLTRLVEKLLGGLLGELLDRALHRLLVAYYTLRLRPLGIDRAAVRRAYRRDVQRVVTGGYAPAIARRFRERCREQLGERIDEQSLEALFPSCAQAGSEPGHALYARLLAEGYGGQP